MRRCILVLPWPSLVINIFIKNMQEEALRRPPPTNIKRPEYPFCEPYSAQSGRYKRASYFSTPFPLTLSHPFANREPGIPRRLLPHRAKMKEKKIGRTKQETKLEQILRHLTLLSVLCVVALSPARLPDHQSIPFLRCALLRPSTRCFRSLATAGSTAGVFSLKFLPPPPTHKQDTCKAN